MTIGTKKKYFITGGIIVALLLVVILRIALTSSVDDPRRLGLALVKVQKPFKETMRTIFTYTGDVVPMQQAAIYSKVSGNLERNYVEMGSYVHSNQMLALIDTTESFQQYQQTNATYGNASMLFERTKQLFEKSLASKQDVDNAEAAMKVAKANYDAAATHLSYAHIVAPFNGFVTRRFLDAGALVSASTSTLFTMMYLDSVKIIVYVPEKDLSQMYHVRTAKVTLDALPNQEFTGYVSRFSEAVDLTTRTMPIEVDIPNRSRIIKPGMFATISFIVSERLDALTLSSNVLLKDDDGYFVFVSDTKKAHKVRINIGNETNSHTEILSGLSGDEDVITTGQQFVKEGTALNIQK
ncbi:MAG: efflux RND transporter periplasmic adaptor subunit [Bacteroidota bacterium]